MNKVIHCYADLDSLYDYRRMLIQKWLVRDMVPPKHATAAQLDRFDLERRQQADRQWALDFEKNYQNRRMDTFDYPHVGMNKAVFKTLFDQRSTQDWVFGHYPSRFMTGFLAAIIDQEQLTEKPISIKGVTLHVNVWPYVLDDELKQLFIDHCLTRFSEGTPGSRVDVKVIDTDVRHATVAFYKQYDYVLKYDLLTSPDYKALSDSIGNPPIPDTTFLVPDLLVKEVEDLQGEVADRIFASSLALAPVFKMVPVNHSFYDYDVE